MKKCLYRVWAVWLMMTWGCGLVYANPGLIQVVAAENFYGSVAQNIGAPYVQVTSVLNSPLIDPHRFEASASVAAAVDKANIVIENGVGYDSWMDHLYALSSKKAVLINVGNILNVLPSQNPHLWYAPQTMPAFAQALTARLCALDPQHKSEYQKNLSYFLQRANLFNFRVNKVKRQVAGETITATEPIFNDLAMALGLKMLNEPIQWKIMNQVALTPADVEEFESSLTQEQVKLLIYNDQVIDTNVKQFKVVAQKEGLPVVGVSELMPADLTYYDWMHQNLVNVAHALGAKI
jgi:zinc/manganese transport system substrate-binding protein